MSINSVFFAGNAVGDAELRHTGSGIAVAKFRIALNRRMSKQNEVDYFDCIAWRQLAEIVHKLVKKGNPVALRGSVQNRKYKPNDGIERTITEVIIDEIECYGRLHRGDNSSDPRGATGDPFADDGVPIDIDDGDLPF